MVTDIQRNKQILTQRATVYQWEVKTHKKCKDVQKIEIKKNVGLEVVIVMFPLPSLLSCWVEGSKLQREKPTPSCQIPINLSPAHRPAEGSPVSAPAQRGGGGVPQHRSFYKALS